MKLENLFEHSDKIWIQGDPSVDVGGLSYDSRTCKKGDMFFAVGGFNADGNAYIQDALAKGAVAVVSENKEVLLTLLKQTQACAVWVPDARKALSAVASVYYGHPSTKLKVIGITGTNGKSSTAFFLKELLESQGRKVGIIGTLGNYFEDWNGSTSHTTPESVEIQAILHHMVQLGADYCIMEVSSHALALHRVENVDFHAGIFTNISQDHLDFHHTMEEYYLAKEKLFRYNHVYAIINTDDPYGRRIYERLHHTNTCPIGFGMEKPTDYRIELEQQSEEGTLFSLIKEGEGSWKIATNQVGAFNAYNVTCAMLAAKMEQLEWPQVLSIVKELSGVRGRMEKIQAAAGFTVILDFAHTPDGLENVLKSIGLSVRGKIITVFGCGGDRDRSKRPIMGRIALEGSDVVVVTSDNPRTEDPMAIIREIEEGMDQGAHRYMVEVDRKKAIEKALAMAKPGDVVVIAGKGHETTQIIGTSSYPFDERTIVEEFLNKHESHEDQRGQ
jgi:UDP-N-acetylmuramoyl-L-alanyl-D-glutamate--2,6-diaminopimelate ligase